MNSNAPARRHANSIHRAFSHIANGVARYSGRPAIFILALAIVAFWAATGPLFHFSDTWRLVINTGTTVVTFLMVFLIQNSQNRNSAAIQVKLDELIRTSAAKNYFVGTEHLTELEIDRLCEAIERRAKNRQTMAHEIDEAPDTVLTRVNLL